MLLKWLQACFLGDVGVIESNSLGDSHFQTNVIDNVENLNIFYIYIYIYISPILCFVHLLVTHTTCKSMLNLVHEIVCVV